MTTLTLELPDDIVTMLEQAAGEQDLTDYALAVLTEAASTSAGTGASVTTVTPGLTPADHTRLLELAQSGPLYTVEQVKEMLARRFPELDEAAS